MYTKEELSKLNIEDLVKIYFDESGTTDQFSLIISSMLKPVLDLCESELGVTSPDNKGLLSIINKYKDAYFKQVTNVYANYYSKNQMIDLIQFYQSPTGKSSVSYQPNIMNDISEYGHEFATNLFKDYEKLILDAV